MTQENPILNSPYEEPLLHYATDSEGALNYKDIRYGRRIFVPDFQALPKRQGPQSSLWEINDSEEQYNSHIVNFLRKEVGKWRKEEYPGTTRVTRELLNFWFRNNERHVTKKLFFAQREAVETAIWLNEIADRCNPGQNAMRILREGWAECNGDSPSLLPRVAFKMATGTGKTVVMACLILYHYLNRREYRGDPRFSDYFLIVTPGITIKDRLGVLFVDKRSGVKYRREDYYAVRDLVPDSYESLLSGLNARLVITNYHAFEPKTLQGNKRSPFDGKINAKGEKQEAKEEFAQVLRRVLGHFKQGSRLLVLNDEAHHCYLPKSSGKTDDNEEADENVRAAVWYRGLLEVSQKFQIRSVYDLSATPYFLSGSGYQSYRLFPWVVSDFGLIEAIEAGLVKIPYLPESDSTQELTMPVLRNLYEHVKNDLPRKGRKRKKSEAKKEGKVIREEPPKIPPLVKAALDQFYTHYASYFEGKRKAEEAGRDLFTEPPVFIVVCNNTSVSKEVYKFIAGYDERNEDDEISTVVDGHYPLLSNYDASLNRPKKKPPTILIDSDALESGVIGDEFKKIFSSEIGEFKRDYALIHGQGSVEKLADAEIIREVVNTVGKPGKLGAHVRCVVSVSMLTEGWDANTVTHIMGLRAFGSQLLCEQVAGRALRRRSYFLQGYDKEGNPTDDRRKVVVEKFPPEYAHIIGIPFKLFKGGETIIVDPPEYVHVRALAERQKDFEIVFPNVVGYRLENLTSEIRYDFSGIENFEIDGTKTPIKTILGTPVSAFEQELTISSVLEKRDQEIVYLITKELIKYHFSDDDGNPSFQLFGKLKAIVEAWYREKVALINIRGDEYKRLLYFEDPKKVVDHIARGINPQINTSEHVRPVMNYYNPLGSTKYVNGNTSKEVYDTVKSHVNCVVEDSGWEAKAAKVLEDLPQVVSYVKNNFLGFTIPYVKDGKDHLYYPDFLARCRNSKGEVFNLVIEITGMSKDKAEKKWFVPNRWLPAVNAVAAKYELGEWKFIEIANDIRDMSNQIISVTGA